MPPPPRRPVPPPKVPAPVALGCRPLAPHVQAALSGTAQRQPAPPARIVAPHVLAATTGLQARVPARPTPIPALAPHVQAALARTVQPRIPVSPPPFPVPRQAALAPAVRPTPAPPPPARPASHPVPAAAAVQLSSLVTVKKGKKRKRPPTKTTKQGDHVFPWLAMKHTMENRLRGLSVEKAAEDLIDYAEGLTESPGYAYAPGWYKSQLTNWIKTAKENDELDKSTIDIWIGQLLGYRNMLPLSVTTYRRSSGGHGEATLLGNLAHYDKLADLGKLTDPQDCFYKPVATAWAVCDYHPPTSVGDDEIAATLAQFIDSMEWAYPSLFADDGIVGEGALLAALPGVIDGFLDRVKDADSRKAGILLKVKALL